MYMGYAHGLLFDLSFELGIKTSLSLKDHLHLQAKHKGHCHYFCQ